MDIAVVVSWDVFELLYATARCVLQMATNELFDLERQTPPPTMGLDILRLLLAVALFVGFSAVVLFLAMNVVGTVNALFLRGRPAAPLEHQAVNYRVLTFG